MADNVDHPPQYQARGELGDDGTVKHEPIKVIEAWGMADGFCAGNAIKYLLRSQHKGTERQDLEKALWYLERLGDPIPAYVPERRHGGEPDKCLTADVVEAWGLPAGLARVLANVKAGCYRSAASELRARLENT
jgi:Protein of unknwon function (DUF3310)